MIFLEYSFSRTLGAFGCVINLFGRKQTAYSNLALGFSNECLIDILTPKHFPKLPKGRRRSHFAKFGTFHGISGSKLTTNDTLVGGLGCLNETTLS